MRGELCDIINGAAPAGAAAKGGAAAEDDVVMGASGGRDAATNKFDAVIGALEDIMCDESFVGAQRSFCLAHCELFEDTDENKLEYTPVFEEYCETMEALIADRLAEAIEDFDMVEFMEMLQEQQESQGGNCEGGPSMQGDVFEMLHELGDFASFKELMLAFKAEGGGDGAGVSHGLDGPQAARPGGGAAAFGLGISVMSLEPSG